MKGYNLYSILLIASASHCMEKPVAHGTITQEELLTLITSQDAHGVLIAFSHHNASKILDDNILKAAEKSASRSASIYTMIKNHLAQAATIPPLEKSSSHKSHHSRHSTTSKKHNERSPQEQLQHMIKKKDLASLKEFVGTSSVHFIDDKAIAYAQKKYESVLASSDIQTALISREYEILQLVKKYASSPPQERRRSCHISPRLQGK